MFVLDFLFLLTRMIHW